MRSTKTLLSLVPPVEARRRAVVEEPEPPHEGIPWYVLVALYAARVAVWVMGALGLLWLVGVV